MGYSSEAYQQEKASGQRLPSGALPLRNLSPFHIEIVKAHLDGVRNKDIADIFRVTESTVSRILSDPLVLAIKAEHSKHTDAQFDALYSEAVNAIRTGLRADDADVALKAAGMFFKYAPSKAGGLQAGISAEDVARQLIAQVNINVNVGGANEKTVSITNGAADAGTHPSPSHAANGGRLFLTESVPLPRGADGVGEECDYSLAGELEQGDAPEEVAPSFAVGGRY